MNKLLLISATMILPLALQGCGNGDEEENAIAPAVIEAPDSGAAAPTEESDQTSTADDVSAAESSEETEEDADTAETEDTSSEEATEEGENSEEEPEE